MNVSDCTFRYKPDGDRIPYFQHDCDQCHFCGSMVVVKRDGKATVKDVWLDAHSESGRTLIMRFSNEDQDYEAFPERVARMIVDSADVGPVDDWKLALELAESYYSNVRPARGNAAQDVAVAMMVRCGRIAHKDSDGTSHRRVFVLEYGRGSNETPEGLALLAARERSIANYFPSTFCQHSHDCCGHWYAGTAKITWLQNGRKALVSQYNYMNV